MKDAVPQQDEDEQNEEQISVIDHGLPADFQKGSADHGANRRSGTGRNRDNPGDLVKMNEGATHKQREKE